MTRFPAARAILVAALAVATSTALLADTPTIGVHVGSHHFPARDFTNVNPGLYARWGNGLTLGALRNSERRLSLYAGHTSDWGPLTITAGVITGYRRANALPLLVPSVRVGRIGDATVRLALLPKVAAGGATAIHLMLEF